MRIDDAGQHQLAAEVDAAGVRPDESAYRLISTDGEDAVAAQRQRLHDAAVRILGMDPAVKECDIRGIGSGPGEARRREHHGARGPGPNFSHSSSGSLSSTLPAPPRTIIARPAVCGRICSA